MSDTVKVWVNNGKPRIQTAAGTFQVNDGIAEVPREVAESLCAEIPEIFSLYYGTPEQAIQQFPAFVSGDVKPIGLVSSEEGKPWSVVDLQEGEFHSSRGLCFRRCFDGFIGINKYATPEDGTSFRITLSIAQWASVVASMSIDGETTESWEVARKFNQEGVAAFASESVDVQDEVNAIVDAVVGAETKEPDHQVVDPFAVAEKGFPEGSDAVQVEEQLSPQQKAARTKAAKKAAEESAASEANDQE